MRFASIAATVRQAVVVCSAVLALTDIAAAQAPGADTRPDPWTVGPNETWTLAVPAAMERVAFSGMASHDLAGGAGGAMLYPAPNVAGLLIAVLTHAALSEAAKSSQKSAAQAEADRVLAPYRPVLDGFTVNELLTRARSYVERSSVPQAAGFRERNVDVNWVVEVTPAFSMTQDQRAIAIDSVINVRRGIGGEVHRRVAVRVLSSPNTSPGIETSWNAHNGAPLKDQGARLLAAAIELSMADLSGAWSREAIPQRTIRYLEGTQERIERASVLERRCARAVIRTLRGDLMSVPQAETAPVDPADRCDARSAIAAAEVPAAPASAPEPAAVAK